MTKEEAIEVFKNDIEICTIQQKQACDMAIEALEQQPCEDTISREQAINELKLAYFNKDLQSAKDDPCIVDAMTDWAIRIIKRLPSVTPKTKVGKWIITDKEHGRIWHCHCSNCKKDPQDYVGGTENWWLVRLPDYCPNCGAKMEVEE